jgi:hypothetical protein
MKTNLRNFIFILFTVVGGLALLADNALGSDETLPPEVKALIGMKISLEAPDNGNVPGWDNLLGSEIVDEIYFNVRQKGNITVYTIKNKNTTILDARVISGNLLNVYLKDGNLEFKKNEMQMYRITAACGRGSSEKKEIILGMWRFSRGSKCTDSSNLVKKAWLLNPESGHITDISTKGVSCREPICGED